METDEIAQYLAALKREDCYRVDAVLKESPYETTQQVSFIGANGAESGPLIRKYIKRELGMGSAYERIYAAQQAGGRFKYVPRILECYSRDDQIAVVMEYVRGETLQDFVYRNDPSVSLAGTVFPELCDAVAELHEGFDQPIIHRDLKPSNIILSDSGLAIIDFGIAREFKADADADTVRFGTREFAPPEQFGFGQTTVRSDVYALGMVLFFCLTETIPTAAIREAGFRDARVPEPLRDVIVQATSFAPERRFASVRALKAAFTSALARCGDYESCDDGEGARRAEPTWSSGSAGAAGADAGGAAEAGGTATAAYTASAAPVNTMPVPEATGQRDRKDKLSARNIVTMVITAFFLIVDLSALVNPPTNVQQHPFWYNCMAFGVIGTLLFLSLGYTFADKKNLAARFPWLARVKTWHMWLLTVIALVVCAAIVNALGYRPAG